MNIESHEPSPNFGRLKSELLNHPEGPALYEDAHFLPKYSNLFSKGCKTEFNASEIVWNRPGQLSKQPVLQSDDISSIYKGHLTPKWFPTLLTILRDRNLLPLVIPNLYSQNTFNQEPLVFTPTSMSYCGAFQFIFRRGGIEENVVIDDRLPCTLNCQLLTAFSSNENEFLPALIEKAYAKYVGGYYNLQKQEFVTALMDFTGGLIEIISMRGDEKLTATEIENVYEKLFNLVGNSLAFCRGYQGHYVESEDRHDPFMSETHIITSCIEIPSSPPPGGVLRSILMASKSNGDDSSKVPNGPSTNYPKANIVPAIKVQSLGDEVFSNGLVAGNRLSPDWNNCSYAAQKWYRLSQADNHEQWMALEELPHFCQNLIFLHLLYRNPILAIARKQPYWKYFFYESYWHRDGPRGSCEDIGEEFLLNDQYSYSVEKEEGSEIKIALVNIQKYVDQGANMITRDTSTKLGITILEVERNRQYRVHELSHTRLQQFHTDCEIDRILVVSTKLQKGTYVIIPWLSVGAGTKYTLQIFSSALNSDSRILDLDIPQPRYCIACQIKLTAANTKSKLGSIYQRPSLAVTNNGYSSQNPRKSVDLAAEMCSDCQSVYPRRATRVSVLQADNLVLSKPNYFPRYFFRITCENETYQSRIVTSTTSSVQWDEHFIFYRSELEDYAISVEVFCEARYGMKASLGLYRFTEFQLRQDEPVIANLEQQINADEFVKFDTRVHVEFRNYFLSELHNA